MLMHHADPQRDRVVRIPDQRRLPVNIYLAAVSFIKAVCDPHDRRFSSSILTDDRMDSALFDLDRNVVIGDNITEGFCDVTEFEHGFWFLVFGFWFLAFSQSSVSFANVPIDFK